MLIWVEQTDNDSVDTRCLQSYDYPDYGARRKLNGAVRDAERFAEWLCDKNIGGGLVQANCKLIHTGGSRHRESPAETAPRPPKTSLRSSKHRNRI